jgi:hypothetical protein
MVFFGRDCHKPQFDRRSDIMPDTAAFFADSSDFQARPPHFELRPQVTDQEPSADEVRELAQTICNLHSDCLEQRYGLTNRFQSPDSKRV